jgi:AcrR family transcriptional regulator
MWSVVAKQRDAHRSRDAILGAAEALFSERGYEAVSLQELGAAAGLSRGTPSYFFGSKEELYVAVLERVFADREEAVERATEPLRRWARDGGDDAALRRALTRAAGDYMRFLVARPAFVRLLAWEGLAGGRRLRATPRASRALQDAFAAVRAAGRRRGTAAFEVEDAVFLFVTLTLSPITQQSTFMTSLGRDLEDPATLRRHVRLVADQLAHLVARPRS